MKKFLLIMLSCATVSAMATETAYVGIKLTGSTTATSTNYKIRVTEDNAYTDNYDNGADAEILSLSPANSQSVFLYAFVEGKKCSSIYDDKLSNLLVGFQTNRVDTKYTITFTSATGRSLKFYDKLLDSTMVITKNATYDFEVNNTLHPSFVAGTNVQINDRFIIEPFNPEPGDLQVCHVGDNLEIKANPFATNIVVKNSEGEKVLDVLPQATPQVISLAKLAKGRYTVEFNEGKEVFVIEVKPDVTPAN